MDIVKSAYNDQTEYFTELKTKIENYFTYSIKFNNIKYKCKICNRITNIETHHDVQCNECGEYFDLVSKLEDMISNFEYPEYTKKEIKAGDDAEIIKFEYDSYYILVLFIVSYEPNSWSSTPHDNYIIKCSVFDNAEKRDECYNKYFEHNKYNAL